MKMQKKELLYEGKAKKVYTTEDPEVYIVSYKDDATAFNGLKKGTIVGKGVVNNEMSNFMFRKLEEQGIPTHYIEAVSYTHLRAGPVLFGGAFHRCPPGRGNLFPKGLRRRLASVPLVLSGGPAGRVAVPLLFKGRVAPLAGEPGAAHPVGLRRFPLFFLQGMASGPPREAGPGLFL